MIDVADHPDPAHDPALVAVVLVEGDDPDDFAIDVDDMWCGRLMENVRR